jgi:Na+/H+-translocating membrane pyrophosphatase
VAFVPGMSTQANHDIYSQAKPNYYACVKLVTTAALSEMRLPGLLTVAMPVTVGMVFRLIGDYTGRPLLG